MNHKDARILKLHRRGLSVERIVKVLGYEPGPEIEARVRRVVGREMKRIYLACQAPGEPPGVGNVRQDGETENGR